MEEVFEDIQKALLADLKKATLAVMKKRGVKASSDLSKSVEWVEEDNVFTLMAEDYFQWVDSGRKKGIMPPPQDLIPWMKKNNITPSAGMTYAQLSFIIARAIKINGIKAKNYITPIEDVGTDIISEELADAISEEFVDELVIILEQNN